MFTDSVDNAPSNLNQNERLNWFSRLRYTKSFLAKLYLADDNLKDSFCALRNAFSQYAEVRERSAFSCVTFSAKRKPIAKITIIGKTLTVHFAIDPSTHNQGKYKLIPSETVKKYSGFPSKFRIRSNGGLKFALAVADEILAGGVSDKKAADFTPCTREDFPTDTFENLIERGLIRPIKQKAFDATDTIDETVSETAESETADNQENEIQAAAETTDETDSQEENGENDVFTDTVDTSAALIGRHGAYDELMKSFLGNAEIKFVKKRLVRSVDERWVNAIEDCLPALDEVLRKPSYFIEETEELLPVERTKKITTQSIKHLCQHTGLISRVENDMVIPSKLLNVFRDESVMTYENKFVNTLLMRLFDFVTGRYETATENGAESVKYVFDFSEDLERGEERGKLSLSLETTLPSDKTEKNRFFSSDLWERVKKLNEIITDYRKSEFAMQMGNASIFPPVVRTNPILKNKNLHQCLELWEFLEGYDDQDGVSVSEEQIPFDEVQEIFAREGLAEQYAVFSKFVSAANAKETQVAESGAESFAAGVNASADAGAKLDFTGVAGAAADTGENAENDISALVDIALQVESLALNELKEQQDEINAEREELLREEIEEIQKEEIKSAADDIPADYPEYEYQPQVKPSEEESAEVADTETPSDESEDERENDGNSENVIYVKSFATKIAGADERIKEYYCEIANAFLSRIGVRERDAFNHVDFVIGRRTLARVVMIGKSLRVFFAISPVGLDRKYRVIDKSYTKRYVATPSLLKIRGPRGLKHALELVSLVCGGMQTTDAFSVKSAGDYIEKSFDESVSAGEIRRRVISRSDKPKEQEVQSAEKQEQPAPRREEETDEKPYIPEQYDYTEEVAAYLKESNKKGRRKKVVLRTLTPTDIAKTIKQVEEDEAENAKAEQAQRIAESAAESERLLKGSDGDRLYVKAAAVATVSGVNNESKKAPDKPKEEKSDAPVEVPPDGDVLSLKPDTLAEVEIMAARKNSENDDKSKQKTGMRGFFARLFGRRNKK